MATSAQYAATPVTALAQVTAANTNRDGTGTIVTVFTGAATGSRVDDLTIKAVSNTTAGMIRLYLSVDGGTTNRLLREIAVPTSTPSGTVVSWSFSLADLALQLQNASTMLRASTNNAQTFNIAVTRAGSY